jgi:hypothetical protein
VSLWVNKYKNDVDEILKKMRVVTHAVFKDKESLTACMKELKETDLGISIFVSGCFDVVDECCKAAGIQWLLTEYSLGVHGRTDRLPPKPYLGILTMCAHAMVAKNHIDHLIRQIKKRKISYEDAGRELAKPCLCGIFNPKRTANLLRKMTEK